MLFAVGKRKALPALSPGGAFLYLAPPALGREAAAQTGRTDARALSASRQRHPHKGKLGLPPHSGRRPTGQSLRATSGRESPQSRRTGREKPTGRPRRAPAKSRQTHARAADTARGRGRHCPEPERRSRRRHTTSDSPQDHSRHPQNQTEEWAGAPPQGGAPPCSLFTATGGRWQDRNCVRACKVARTAWRLSWPCQRHTGVVFPPAGGVPAGRGGRGRGPAQGGRPALPKALPALLCGRAGAGDVAYPGTPPGPDPARIVAGLRAAPRWAGDAAHRCLPFPLRFLLPSRPL